MTEIITLWMNKPVEQQLIIVGILLIFLFIAVLILKSVFTMLRAKKKGQNSIEEIDLGIVKLKLKDESGNDVEINASTSQVSEIVSKKDAELSELKNKYSEIEKQYNEIKYILDKKQIEEDIKKEYKSVVPMSKHVVFFNLQRYMERGIDISSSVLNKCTEIKCKILRVFIEDCKIKIFYTRLLEYVTQLETLKDDKECDSLIFDIVNKLYMWIEEYNTMARKIPIELPDGKVIIGVPEILIKKFDMWHEKHIQYVLERINISLNSDFYHSWQLKLITILDAIDTGFYLTKEDAEYTLIHLNGELEEEIKKKIGG